MAWSKSKIKNLVVGDLVTHVLYGKEWVGVIIEFKDDPESVGSRSEKALIQIQPGTKYEGFFGSKVTARDKLNDNLGYVTTNWLFKLEIRNGNSKSTRSKTPQSG